MIDRTRLALTLAVLCAAVLAVAVPHALGGRSGPDAYEASRSAGIRESTHTWSANVGDFNRDGWQDFLLVRHDGASRLYQNRRGRFVEVNRGNFPEHRDPHDCAWGNANTDRRPDVYCTTGGKRGRRPRPKELWIQQPDGSFVNRAAEFGVEDVYGRGRATTFVDANGDRFPDLYVGNGYPRFDGRRSRNRLYLNQAGRRFVSVPRYGLDREVGGKSIQAVDYDRDGWEDLLVCGQERLFLYENVRGRRFRDVTRRANVPRACNSALLARVNGDRRLDLVRVEFDTLTVALGHGGGFGRVVERRSLERGRDVAAGDVNRDGLRDLYVLQAGRPDRDERDLMLLNEGRGKKGGHRGFRQISIPQTRAGVGDSVEMIDYDRNGRSDFIVLNGQGTAAGPVRLVAFRR